MSNVRRTGEKKNWIQHAVKRPGALHKALGVKKGKGIPAKKLTKALHSKNEHVRKMAQFAKNMKSIMNKKKH